MGYLLRLPVSGFCFFLADRYRLDDIPIIHLLETYSPSTIDYLRYRIAPLLIIGAILLLVPYWKIARWGAFMLLAALSLEALEYRTALPMWDLQSQINDLLMASILLVPIIICNEAATRLNPQT